LILSIIYISPIDSKKNNIKNKINKIYFIKTTMRNFFKLAIVFLFFVISKAEFAPQHKNLTDLLKDFAKGPEAYLEKIGNRVKHQILKEILKFSLTEFVHNTSGTSQLNVTNANFQNVLPFLQFFRLMNLTNHTKDELEKLIIESIPSEYNSSDFLVLRSNRNQWDDFAEKFIRNVLMTFITNKTQIDFFDHIYQKLRMFHNASNSSSHANLTEKLDMLGAISHEVLANKETITDIAKNIHSEMKDEGGNYKSKESSEPERHEISQMILMSILVVLIVALLIIFVFLFRRYYKKNYSSTYNQMEGASSLTAA